MYRISLFIFSLLFSLNRLEAASRSEMADLVEKWLTRDFRGSLTAKYRYKGRAEEYLRLETDNNAFLAIQAKELRPLKADVIFTDMHWFGRNDESYWELDSSVLGRLKIGPAQRELSDGTEAMRKDMAVLFDNVNLFSEWPYSILRLGLPGCNGEPYVKRGELFLGTNHFTKCRVVARIVDAQENYVSLKATLHFAKTLHFKDHTIGRLVHVTTSEENEMLRPASFGRFSIEKGKTNENPSVTGEYLSIVDEVDFRLLSPDGLFRPGLGEVFDLRPDKQRYTKIDPSSNLHVSYGPFVLRIETMQTLFWAIAAALFFGTVAWRAVRKGRNRQ